MGFSNKNILMKVSICNEVIKNLSFEEQCRFAASLGYDGIEIAPFTLSPNPHLIDSKTISRMRAVAETEGIALTSLHWLLTTPPGLSITSQDADVLSKTEHILESLITLCSDLGGSSMVHGSPAQRIIKPDQNRHEIFQRVAEMFQRVSEQAKLNNIVYCIEPLDPSETNFINNLQEAVDLVKAVDSPFFKTMLDCKAARSSETVPVEKLLDTWLPTGDIAHVHLNDCNRKGPGQGPDTFAEVIDALHRHSYQGVVAVEPFDYVPDGPLSAARAAGFVQGLREGLAFQKS